MKRSRKFLIVLILLLFANLLNGPTGSTLTTSLHWEFAGWYGGGCYPNVEFDPNIKDRVYLTSDVAGIWRSDDLGEHWVFINEGLGNLDVACIAVAPKDSHILYAGTRAGLFRSKNSGQNWALCNTANEQIKFKRPESYRSVAVSRTDPAQVAVGTSTGGLFYSKDYGDHWDALSSLKNPFNDNKPITALQWTPDGSMLYVAAEKGVIVYSFLQNRWNVLAGSPQKVTDLIFSEEARYCLLAAGQKALFISEDAGQTWRSSSWIFGGQAYRIAEVKQPQTFRLIIAWINGWKGGILKTDNLGRRWDPLEKKMNPDRASDPTRAWTSLNGRINALKVSPHDPQVMFRTDFWGVWRSDDGGMTWNEKIIGAPNTVGSDIAVTEDGVIYVATMDNGLLKSEDGGNHYEPLFPTQGYKNEINGHVWRILALGPKKIIATSSPWGENINQVIISDDGGKSFDLVRSGLPAKRPKINTMWWEGFPRALAVDPQNSNTIYLGIDGDDGGGFFISQDAGRHWHYPKRQPDSKRINNALAVDPTDTNRIFWGGWGKKGGIYLSEDKGASWKLVFNEMSEIFDIAIGNKGAIYAGGGKNGACLYSSQDHGKTWQFLRKFSDGGCVGALFVNPKNEKKITLSSLQWSDGEQSGGRIYLSNDGGSTWADITGDLPNGPGAAKMAFNPMDSSLYITRPAGSVYKMKSADG